MLASLIPPENAWLLWAVILSGVALSIFMEQRYRWAARLSGPVLALVIAMVLSNLKVMPTEAPSYDVIWHYLVPLSIPLLLFRANFVKLISETGSMFWAFHISALGTMIGAILATLILGSQIDHVAEIAAIMTGSYSGGGVNFFALKSTFDISAELTNPLLVADNFIMAGMFVTLLVLGSSKFLRRHFPHPHSQAEDTQQAKNLAAEHWKRKGISLLDVAQALAIAFVIAALSSQAAGWFKDHFDGVLEAFLGNMYLLITIGSVSLATLCHRWLERIQGAEELGAYLLYVFLFAVGLPADLVQVIQNVPLLFVFCLIMALTNLAITLLVGWGFKMKLEELLICVNATLGGAPSAAAMAISKGWSKLVLPGLLVGIWGYVIGTPLGIAIGQILLRIYQNPVSS